MFTEIDCLWMINVSFVPGAGGPCAWQQAVLPPLDPHGVGAVGHSLGLSDLPQQSRGLCRPAGQGGASQKFLVNSRVAQEALSPFCSDRRLRCHVAQPISSTPPSP